MKKQMVERYPFAAPLTRERRAAMLTQVEAAELLEIPYQTYIAIETRRVTGARHRERILKGLQTMQKMSAQLRRATE